MTFSHLVWHHSVRPRDPPSPFLQQVPVALKGTFFSIGHKSTRETSSVQQGFSGFFTSKCCFLRRSHRSHASLVLWVHPACSKEVLTELSSLLDLKPQETSAEDPDESVDKTLNLQKLRLTRLQQPSESYFGNQNIAVSFTDALFFRCTAFETRWFG